MDTDKKENIENEKENSEKMFKRGKVNIKVFVFIFILIYLYLQLGFSGLYTYTTISVLYTCLMYFSIFALYSFIWAFFKFRKKQFTKNEVDKVLKNVLKSVIIIILLYSIMNIVNYISNMNGIIIAKENYSTHSKKIQNIVDEEKTNIVNENIIENSIENVVERNSNDTNEKLEIVESMFEYNAVVGEMDNLYNEMKEKMPIYIGLRLLTDIVDILATIVVLAVLKLFVKKVVIFIDEEVK